MSAIFIQLSHDVRQVLCVHELAYTRVFVLVCFVATEVTQHEVTFCNTPVFQDLNLLLINKLIR